jgi:hypothetical protein
MPRARIKKKNISKGESITKKRKSIKNAYFGFKTQMEMFDYIWNTRPHICWMTRRQLKYGKGDSKWKNQFAHGLRKGTYTYFKLNPDNIKLLDPIIHDLVDNFKEEYRQQLPHIDFDKWFSYQAEMKIKYKDFKDKNLLA